MALPSQEIQALAQAAEEEKKRQEEAAKLMTAGAGSLGLFKAQQAAAELANEAAERQARPLTHNQGGNLTSRGSAAQPRPFRGNVEITGPRGGTGLPAQPSLDDARTAATRSAYSANTSTTGGFNNPAGSTSTGTSGGSASSGARSILNTSKDVFNTAKNKVATGLNILSKMPAGVQNLEAMYYGGLDRIDDLQRLTNTGNYSSEAIAAANQRFEDQREMIERNRFSAQTPQGKDAMLNELFRDVEETPEQAETRRLAERQAELNYLEERTNRLSEGITFNAPNKEPANIGRTFDNFLGNMMRLSSGDRITPTMSDIVAEEKNKLEAFREGRPMTPEVPEAPKTPVTQEAPATLEVPKTDTSEFEPIQDPPTALDRYNTAYNQLMEKQGGEISDSQIRQARRTGGEEGFGFDPKKGFFNRDFEGQEFEGQSIGEYLSVGFQPRKLDEEGNPMGSQVEIVGTEGMPVNFNPSSDQEMVKTLDPNTGDVIMADRETANQIADFYARQRRGEALTRQEALESGAMRDFSNRQLNNVINSEYAQASRDREERIRNRPNFFEPVRSNADVGAKKYGGYTTAELRDLVGGGGKALRRAKVLAAKGKDPLTGKDVNDPNEMTAYQKEALKLQQDRLDFAKNQAGKEGDMTDYQKESLQLAKDKFEQSLQVYEDAQKALSETDKNEEKLEDLRVKEQTLKVNKLYFEEQVRLGKMKDPADDKLPPLDLTDYGPALEALEDNFKVTYDAKTGYLYRGRKRAENIVYPNDSIIGPLIKDDPLVARIFNNYPVIQQ